MNYRTFRIKKADLGILIGNLKRSFLLIGPAIEGEVLTLKEMDPHHLPSGFRDSQSPGHYRHINKRDENIFAFSNGPDSFKRFFHPPLKEVFRFKRTKKGLQMTEPPEKSIPVAFFGIRSCDVKALKILDMVFSGLEGTLYHSMRRNSFIIGLNCLYPSENCFCLSLDTGPEIKNGCDMIITELKEHLLIESGVEGIEFLKGIDYEEASKEDFTEKELVIKQCRAMIKRSVNTKDLPLKIYRNLEHPRWSQVSERCLACGNCTQVCPTCFCNSAFDSIDISSLKRPEGFSGKRIRVWDSCFSMNFARVHGGNFRPSRRARYRHWLSHKFGYWIDQFGVIGCVGCGRCITWCPVGIDITEELEALGG